MNRDIQRCAASQHKAALDHLPRYGVSKYVRNQHLVDSCLPFYLNIDIKRGGWTMIEKPSFLMPQTWIFRTKNFHVLSIRRSYCSTMKSKTSRTFWPQAKTHLSHQSPQSAYAQQGFSKFLWHFTVTLLQFSWNEGLTFFDTEKGTPKKRSVFHHPSLLSDIFSDNNSDDMNHEIHEILIASEGSL